MHEPLVRNENLPFYVYVEKQQTTPVLAEGFDCSNVSAWQRTANALSPFPLARGIVKQ